MAEHPEFTIPVVLTDPDLKEAIANIALTVGRLEEAIEELKKMRQGIDIGVTGIDTDELEDN